MPDEICTCDECGECSERLWAEADALLALDMVLFNEVDTFPEALDALFQNHAYVASLAHV